MVLCSLSRPFIFNCTDVGELWQEWQEDRPGKRFPQISDPGWYMPPLSQAAPCTARLLRRCSAACLRFLHILWDDGCLLTETAVHMLLPLLRRPLLKKLRLLANRTLDQQASKTWPLYPRSEMTLLPCRHFRADNV